jgi:hypothetical protein
MGALYDPNMVSIVFTLMDRGIKRQQIERAMRHMIGDDWREVSIATWLKRLKIQGYVLHNDRELTISDLEALVQGRIALEGLSRNSLETDT